MVHNMPSSFVHDQAGFIIHFSLFVSSSLLRKSLFLVVQFWTHTLHKEQRHIFWHSYFIINICEYFILRNIILLGLWFINTNHYFISVVSALFYCFLPWKWILESVHILHQQVFTVYSPHCISQNNHIQRNFFRLW